VWLEKSSARASYRLRFVWRAEFDAGFREQDPRCRRPRGDRHSTVRKKMAVSRRALSGPPRRQPASAVRTVAEAAKAALRRLVH
jgi:hypothetical protein